MHLILVNCDGGLRKVEDIEKAFISGADKVSLNTIFHQDLSLINKIVKIFGNQAIVGSIKTKKLKMNGLHLQIMEEQIQTKMSWNG